VRLFGALVAVTIAAAAAVPSVAKAGLTPAELGRASAQAHPGAQLPLALRFVDDNGTARTLGDALGGRPGVLVFSDYTCRTLCGPILEFVAAGLVHSGLRAGTDYGLVAVGLNPKNLVADARAMRAAHFDTASPLANAATLLTGDEAAIHSLTRAAGYNYQYDAEHDQFAHATAVYAITPQGRVARALSALGLDGNDLRLALIDAGDGRVGSFIDHLRLLCYRFDPAQGIYTSMIERWLTAACAATALLIAGWLALLVRWSRGEPA
jgi:protein SCO1/2